jgi:hypothetical protein
MFCIVRAMLRMTRMVTVLHIFHNPEFYLLLIVFSTLPQVSILEP